MAASDNLSGAQFEHVSLDRFNDNDIRPGDYSSWSDVPTAFLSAGHKIRLRMAQDELARGEARPVTLNAAGDRLLDGHHRVVAHRLAGYPSIRAERGTA